MSLFYAYKKKKIIGLNSKTRKNNLNKTNEV